MPCKRIEEEGYCVPMMEAMGVFGDGRVPVGYLPAPSREAVFRTVLFHGVHGCASPEPDNKYGHLARLCNERDMDVCIVETSRSRRDRDAFVREDTGDDRVGWALAAFAGKTFAMELADICSALERIDAELPPKPTVLWGFSLGGIISVLVAGAEHGTILREAGLRVPAVSTAFAGVITSGSGDRIRAEAKAQLALPVLDSVPPAETLHRAAGNLRAGFFLSFYGDRDASFDESSVRRIFDLVPLPENRKVFTILSGADHAFRTLDGKPSDKPLRDMTDFAASFTARAIPE